MPNTHFGASNFAKEPCERLFVAVEGCDVLFNLVKQDPHFGVIDAFASGAGQLRFGYFLQKLSGEWVSHFRFLVRVGGVGDPASRNAQGWRGFVRGNASKRTAGFAVFLFLLVNASVDGADGLT